MKSVTVTRFGSAAVIGSFLILLAAFATRFGTDPAQTPSPLLGQPVPELALLKLEPDSSRASFVSTSDFKGRVLVVSFFGSWCERCHRQQPSIQAVAETFSQLDVGFLAIPYHDSMESVIDFLDDFGWSDSITYASDPGSSAAIAFGVQGVPTIYIVDPEGIVADVILHESTALSLGSAIDAILEETQSLKE